MYISMMCKKEVLFGGTCCGRTRGGCEWIEDESELPSTCMFLPLCVQDNSMPPVLFYVNR